MPNNFGFVSQGVVGYLLSNSGRCFPGGLYEFAFFPRLLEVGQVHDVFEQPMRVGRKRRWSVLKYSDAENIEDAEVFRLCSCCCRTLHIVTRRWQIIGRKQPIK